jgi:hypothetical protein
MSTSPITRGDIEAKLREIEGGVKQRLDDSRQKIIAVAGGVGLVLLVLAYLLGKRKGKKKTTFVEIRRL